MKLEQEVAALKEQNARLEERLTKLEPTPPFVNPEPSKRTDPTAHMTMPNSALRAMVECVPDFRAIAREQSRGVALPTVPPQISAPPGSGWIDPIPLKSR